MQREAALRLLNSPKPDERLRAARVLSHVADPDDLEALSKALADETNRWVKSALTKAAEALQNGAVPARVEVSIEGEEERIFEEIHSEAVEETTQRLIHEIRPILGRLDVHASREIDNYEASRTKAEWNNLHALLAAIDKLGQAASPPVYAEFDLSELVEGVVNSENTEGLAKVDLTGPKPLMLVSSSSLIQIILCNGVRNAIEATAEAASSSPIVVSWGTTDRDFWIVVLDDGKGMPPGLSKAFDIGTTTKKEHLGMGLALARQAALSLSGRISLSPRNGKGAKFEFSCPLYV